MPQFYKDGCLVDEHDQVMVREVTVRLTAQQARDVAAFLAKVRQVDTSPDSLLVWTLYKNLDDVCEGKLPKNATTAGTLMVLDLREVR